MPFLPPEKFSLVLTVFVSYLSLALPTLLLGIVVSSVLMVWTDESRWIGRLPRHRLLACLAGSGLGFLLPLGSVGVIPVVRRLLLQGAPLPGVIAFWIAAPTLNWATILATLNVLPAQPKLIFLRIALTWFMAIGLGLLFSLYGESSGLVNGNSLILSDSPLLRSGTVVIRQHYWNPLHRSGNLHYDADVKPLHLRPRQEKLRLFIDNVGDESLEFGGILILTTAIAAGVMVYFPLAEFLLGAQTAREQVLLMLGLGFFVPLEATFNVGFLVPYLETFWAGGLLAFLLLGSWLNLQTLGLGLITFRLRPLFYLVVIVSQMTLVFAFLFNNYGR